MSFIVERPAAPAVGKKFINKCAPIVDRSPLIIVGGGYDQLKITGPKIASGLVKCLQGIEDPEEIFLLRTHFLNALGSVLLLNEKVDPFRKDNYCDRVGGLDLDNIPFLARDLVLARSKTPTVAFRVVYGATEQMPFRALSGVLAPLIMMEGLAQDKLPLPQLQVIFANNISSSLNERDGIQAKAESEKFAMFCERYIVNFFPELRDSVVFLSDQPLSENERLQRELLEIAGVISKNVSVELLERLGLKNANHGNNGNHFQYAAAHLWMHDTPFIRNLQRLTGGKQEVADPEIIVSFGGRQEMDFYRLRHEVKPYLGSEFNSPRTAQYFTRNFVPPYYQDRNGDLLLEDVLNNPRLRLGKEGVGESAKFDIDYISRVSSTRGDSDLGEFLDRY